MHDEDSDSVPWPATRNNTQYGLRPGGGGRSAGPINFEVSVLKHR